MKKVIRTTLKIVGFLLLAILVVFGVFIGYMAVQSNRQVILPTPTGKYYVGRTVFDWTDQARTNAFAGKPNEKRELMVMTWYPTDAQSGTRASYLPQPWLDTAEKDQSGFGEILTHKLTNVQTNSYTDVPMSKSQKAYPVIILEPGLGRASYDYSSIAEDLASHGYIVLSSTPTYLADLAVFENGRIATAASSTKLSENETALSPNSLAKLVQLRDIYAGDISYLLTKAEQINVLTGSDWAGRLDTSRIGVMGHSLGGAAAYHVCLTDTRCKVTLDIDGTLFGEENSVAKVPFMFLSSDTSNDTNTDAKKEDSYNQAILDKQGKPFYQVTIRGAEHFNFSDLALRSRFIRYLGALGSVDGHVGIELNRLYEVALFDKYLVGAKPTRLNPNNTLPGSVIIQR